MSSFEHENYSNPIYIYAPRYLAESAGIRTLHYLCHILNHEGHLAWIVPSDPIVPGDGYVSGFLNTPLLNAGIMFEHFHNGKPPIVIYPETTLGNPLKAQVVARWLLNYPGVLGGQIKFNNSEYLFAYSKSIADSYDEAIPVLFIPPVALSEIDEVNAEQHLTQDKLGTLYAGKFRHFKGIPRIPEFAAGFEIVEIHREAPKKQSRREVLRLLATSEVLFAYENSSIITEATLLGTPVVLIQSDFFPTLIAEHELSSLGTAWSHDHDPIEAAKKGISDAQSLYVQRLERVNLEVSSFAKELKVFASSFDYLAPIKFHVPKSSLARKIFLAWLILRKSGVRELSKEVMKFFRTMS